MNTERETLAGRPCLLCGGSGAKILLIQPTGGHEEAGFLRMAETIAASADVPFALAGFSVTDWNGELSPWDAPAVFGSEGFGHGAGDTLSWLTQELLPALTARFRLQPDVPMILGGYSLAGFFALWAAYQTDRFAAAAAVSPSVWFPGWLDYARTHPIRTHHLYLSLGRKEPKTRNQVMAAVGENIRAQADLAAEALGQENCLLEWNEGNHFRDPELRCAKGFFWALTRAVNAELC